jgi:hypothetical protein
MGIKLPGGDARDNEAMADLDDLRDRFAHALERARPGAEGPDPAPYADDLLTRW